MLMRKNVNNDVSRIRLYLWTSENDAKTRADKSALRKRYEWTRIFLKKEKKELLFQTNTDTCGQGLSHLC